jgi:PIN domain nuclease of toxin-antitoxin system
MRLLLDTHTLLWWLSDDPNLPPSARKLMARGSSSLLVSAASAWEIAIKVRSGKLQGAAELAADFAGHLAREQFEPLPITVEHAVRAGLLPGPHRDPFDRMLIAQAQAENVPIISNDAAFDDYRVRRLW